MKQNLFLLPELPLYLYWAMLYSCCIVLYSRYLVFYSCCLGLCRVVLVLCRVDSCCYSCCLVLCCVVLLLCRVVSCCVVLARVVTRVVFQTRSIMEARALNNLLCYYTENDVSMKVRGRRYDLSFVNPRKGRSSRSQIFFKIGALKNFANFSGKHLCF